ncbi:MAG TPA: HAD hydrolase-like protein [Candidatus Saccharimonadales bacterium]|nr:HAD hydrolase-like protein [Candidatus Saccharimonadales bacterium]
MDRDTIIFDFDGTIADSLSFTIEIFRKLTGWQGAQTPEEIARFRRMPLTKVVKEVGVPFLQIPSLLMRGRKIMTARITEVPPFPGMSETIHTLHERGHRLLVMSSNSGQNVKKFLAHNKLDAYFDAVYGNVGLFNKAGALRRVTRINKIDRNSCFYIGDEQRDVDGARRVGVKVIAVAWGYNDPELLQAHQPFALAHKPADILEILRK